MYNNSHVAIFPKQLFALSSITNEIVFPVSSVCSSVAQPVSSVAASPVSMEVYAASGYPDSAWSVPVCLDSWNIGYCHPYLFTQVIVNVEAQKDEPTKYQILNRAIFYISRLISSQKQRDFVNMNYNDIKKVYSIWVCMGMKENTMCHIHLTKDDLIGYHNWQGNLYLLNIIMIGISDILPEHDNIYEMHRLLSALFSEKLSAAEKIDIINNEYDIPVANNIMEEVNIMCNLSQGIEDKALEAGKTAAQIDIILNMYKNNFTVEQIALATQHKVDEVKEIIKNN